MQTQHVVNAHNPRSVDPNVVAKVAQAKAIKAYEDVGRIEIS